MRNTILYITLNISEKMLVEMFCSLSKYTQAIAEVKLPRKIKY